MFGCEYSTSSLKQMVHPLECVWR